MVKTIIFDMGGVLLEIDNAKVCAGLAQFCDCSLEEIFSAVFLSNDLKMLEKGMIPFSEYYRRISDKLSLKLNINMFRKIFQDNIVGLNRKIVDLFNKVLKTHRVLILSNNNVVHFGFANKKFGRIFSKANDQIISYKVGMRKPELQIYRMAVKLARAKPDEILYFDDVKKFAHAARKVGIIGIQYTQNTNLKGIMKKYSIL